MAPHVPPHACWWPTTTFRQLPLSWRRPAADGRPRATCSMACTHCKLRAPNTSTCCCSIAACPAPALGDPGRTAGQIPTRLVRQHCGGQQRRGLSRSERPTGPVGGRLQRHPAQTLRHSRNCADTGAGFRTATTCLRARRRQPHCAPAATATTMRALRRLLREELHAGSGGTGATERRSRSLDERLHRLRSSCGFCGAATNVGTDRAAAQTTGATRSTPATPARSARH